MNRSPGSAVVVGGGLAGITAALDLADSGVRVQLVEVRRRLGGAAYSFEREGISLDNGQHVFLRCCTDYRALLDRIGAADRVTLQRRLTVPVLSPGGRKYWLKRSALPAPLHLGSAVMRYGVLTSRERLSAMRAALELRRLDLEDPALDAVTFGDWLAERGQSAGAVGGFWNLIALPTLNLHASEASLALAAMVFQRGLLTENDAGDIGYARLPLSQVHAEPAAQALAGAGVDVMLGTRALAVEQTDTGELTVECETRKLTADAVVVAVQHSRVAALLPTDALADPAKLDRLGASPIVNLHVVYDRPVLDLPFVAGAGSPVQFVFDRTDSSGVAEGQCLAVSLSAADREMEMGSARLRDEFLPALAQLLPRARAARVTNMYVTREHAATFRATPGVADLRPGPRTAIRGLTLAGAWTDTGWPATMEGAVRSGHAASAEALRALEHRKETIPVPA